MRNAEIYTWLWNEQQWHARIIEMGNDQTAYLKFVERKINLKVILTHSAHTSLTIGLHFTAIECLLN